MHSNTRGSFQIIGIMLVILLLVTVGAAAAVMSSYLKNAPSLDDVRDVKQRASLPTVVYDANGKVLTKLMIENRIWVPLSSISPDLIDAVIAVEDHTFYEHHGISVRRILGALWYDIRHMSTDQGASTITAQLARNVFLSMEKTLNRKIYEAMYAFQLERKYTKDEILEYYLNWVYFGHGTYGVEAASQLFFGKHASELSTNEAALLAGVPKGAEIYSPLKNPEKANGRRKVVLRRMVEVFQDDPRPAKREAAQRAALALAADKDPVLADQKKPNTVGRYAVFMIRDYLISQYGSERVYRGGMSVKTTIDLNAQRAAEQAFASLLPKGRVESRKDGRGDITYPQGALIAINAQTGQIRAIVGGRGEDEYNRAIRAERSPGSTIKPFVYSAAIDAGYTPASIVTDQPLSFPMGDGGVWAPKNFSGKFQGQMTLRHALEQSVNMIAIQLLRDLGPKRVIDLAKKMGITSLVESGQRNDVGLALALGGLTRGIKPIEMVEAYSALANGGAKVKPYFIIEVRGADGGLLESSVPKREIVLDERTAYIMVDMMKGVISSPKGTGKRASIGRPAAGKTGTSDSNTDAWFVGFTPDMVTAVWIGEDTTREMRYPGIGVVGSSKAAEIWAAFMKKALNGVPARDFPMPQGISTGVRICESSGKLASSNCPADRVVEEKFVSGTEPVEECPIHGRGGYSGTPDGNTWGDRSVPGLNPSQPQPTSPTDALESDKQPVAELAPNPPAESETWTLGQPLSELNQQTTVPPTEP
ncbi:MAG: PBP1A family penicillin-binding protein [Clostridia bacterium]|nr:PBP1A family penicillin-binding protein [Clostridia bacterium]